MSKPVTHVESLPIHHNPKPPPPPPKDEGVAQYPGFGYALELLEPVMCPIGAHPNSHGADTDILPVREVAMMQIMDSLTDKAEWERKVFDDEIVAKWRQEALSPDMQQKGQEAAFDSKDFIGMDYGVTMADSTRLVSQASFDYCIKELREKAEHYSKTKLIPTLDACSTVVKSDALLPSELQEPLRQAFSRLRADQGSSPDWHPGSDEKVLDFVHPSLFPLVYGRSRAFKKEAVRVQDAVLRWAGRGEPIKQPMHEPQGRFDCNIGGLHVSHTLWSTSYQWLPSNVKFTTSGEAKLSSYVNNLHPQRYPEIYSMIENLIDISVPMWDQALKVSNDHWDVRGPGRSRSRFNRHDQRVDDETHFFDPQMPRAEMELERERQAKEISEEEEREVEADDIDENETETYKHWVATRQPVLPEPEECAKIDYEVKSSLKDRFTKQGLQVIVKMASIELTPEKPDFPQGSWHIEGQMNEHIAATALFYVDCDNITPSRLSFRQPTSAYESDNFTYEQDSYSYLEALYGTRLGNCSECLQNLGSVSTHQGRVVAFPNVLQHRVGSFRLKDPTKPGHRRFIALWLVDPYTRIISTANVPPQQQSWWLGSAFGAKLEGHSKLKADLVRLLSRHGADLTPEIIQKAKDDSQLPKELAEMLNDLVTKEDLPMTWDEAKEHRLKLMAERTTFKDEVNDGLAHASYNFCEH